jgi:hypothetical protein
MRRINQVQWLRCAAGVVLISFMAGCKRDEARVYHIANEDAPPAPAEMPAASPPAAAPAALPQINYQLPEHWQEKPPAEMRVASFTALGTNGESADVSVIPLPIVGRDLDLVNMWRSQVQLPATSDPDAVNQAAPVFIGAEQGRLFEFVSAQPLIGNSRQRIQVAVLTRGDMSWFFKITGADAFVSAQKENFLAFLKSVTFADNSPAETTAAPPAQTGNSKSLWTVPPDWQPADPGPMLFAKFSITSGDGKADVNISSFAGDGGGLLANVNRWRGQLGLPQAADIQPDSFNVVGGSAQAVDLTGTDAKTGKPARLVGVIVPQNGQTWFYKLMGDPQTVAPQKDAFIKFIQSAQYPR